MMKKIYYLSTCDTCKNIIKRLGGLKDYEWQDIKTVPITKVQLKEMKDMAGSYEALFSRRAIKYKEMGLKDQVLQEKDFQRLILQEYTFLKRPVVIIHNKIFVGSEKKTVEGLKKEVNNRLVD